MMENVMGRKRRRHWENITATRKKETIWDALALWKHNIKTDIKKSRSKFVDWNIMSQETFQWSLL
jgi:hypothetical protein